MNYPYTYTPKKVTKRGRAIKLIFIQLALIVALLSLQIAMIFFHDYRIIVIQPKNNSWQNIAEGAEGSLSYCQNQLAQAQQDKLTAEQAANPDLFK